jgi:spore coat protein U-like protein
MLMRMKFNAPVAAGVLLALAGTAHADTRTNTFEVTATVARNCLITAGSLNLGIFDGTNNLDTATSTVSVRCTAGTPFTVGLSTGLNSTDFAARKLKKTDSADTLTYNLYRDGARTEVWNETTQVVGGLGAGMSLGNAVPLTVYGKLVAAGNEDAPQGSYSDTITATVTY